MSKIVTVLTATDLHQRKSLYDELERVVQHHRPDIVALVGDFLDASDHRAGRFTATECAEHLSRLASPHVVFVRGNHEEEAWQAFAAAWSETGRRLNALHGEVFVHGPMVLVGFPCLLGDETSYLGPRPSLPADATEWLPSVLRANGSAMRTLWLMHEPPAGTPLSEPDGPLAGNPEWVEAIERFAPLLAICGHDHETPIQRKRWHYEIGQTRCVNVGQSDTGSLHYCLFQAEFPKPTPCLPTAFKVTAFPWKRTIRYPERSRSTPAPNT